MRGQRYNLEVTELFTVYEFISDGPKGEIVKLVKYTKVGIGNTYNLGFGDKIGDTDEFDDMIVTDNSDGLKVLSTVAGTIYSFTDAYPKSMVFAVGSTPSRTRLYRIGISNNLSEIKEDFNVFGYLKNQWTPFEKNQNYEAFLIVRK